MKSVYAAVFGIGAFFAMNCGAGEEAYPEPSPSRGQAAQQESPNRPAQPPGSAERVTRVDGAN
jgi:hypothetical protein